MILQASDLDWQWRNWEQLSPKELYAILKHRSDIFVVEQQDPYNDIDGFDSLGVHLIGYHEGEIVAYGRLLPSGVQRDETVMGRLCIRKDNRSNHIGINMIMKLLKKHYDMAPEDDVYVYTQTYWVRAFLNIGGVPISPPMSKSRIEHIEVIIKNETIKELVDGKDF